MSEAGKKDAGKATYCQRCGMVAASVQCGICRIVLCAACKKSHGSRWDIVDERLWAKLPTSEPV